MIYILRLRRILAKKQKIKSKYYIYANILFTVLTIIIFTLLYYFSENKEYFANIAQTKTSDKNDDSFSKEANKPFQPGDKEAYVPGKLKWGKDF